MSTALTAVGAAWEDVSDVVLTHAHYDYVGGLPGSLDSPRAQQSGSAAQTCRTFRRWPDSGCDLSKTRTASASFRSCTPLAIPQDISACYRRTARCCCWATLPQ
ncbi:MAG: MBL fold metallo-hydrolase [Geodermatophilaceae bacterium]|nr:MBL fold metallo-hydrolase [Geodermatophilaceae bacterium]